ncbi:hypothetical protein DCC81_03980 [Chitinophaga parva]|uniref:RagB/SusD family nutrient uptake outer membrane protein n=1 Tax=Chitinophaga parva TaxID=2169414 RepID=A0A2T7BM05_9BACT|nr:RagB/SusD family nutrient uptake outer membrane protein [Chitinophaga parva]PUZ28651.1 hypothetical protein DCC81_03980 [Chitinophaga parva]
MTKCYKFLIPVMAGLLLACNKQVDEIKPLTKVTADGELATVGGIEAATLGTYAIMCGGLEYSQQDFGESRGNNVTQANWAPVSIYTDAFFFQNSNVATLGGSYGFYQGCYQLITSVNLVLDHTRDFDTHALTDEQHDRYNYVIGENLFIRALAYFNLVRVYGKPFYLDGGAGTGVGLKKTGDINDKPSPSSVKEVYEFIINDLKTAAQLMKAPVAKTNSFANTGAAWGLLSRVYLYMGGSPANPDAAMNKLAVAYADSVIEESNGKYALLQGAAYQQMFADDEDGNLGRSDPSGNKEIIFAINNTSLTYGSQIGQMYHHDPIYGVGATFKPSADLMGRFKAGDVRGTFFKVNSSSGFNETTKWLCINYYTGTKAPAPVLRLAEMYLNRAEANAKLGNVMDAKADLKVIHVRAGLPATDVDDISNANLLDAILLERRLELAFEGHLAFDYFRNGLPMTRIAADNNGTAVTIQADDPKVVLTVPSN